LQSKEKGRYSYLILYRLLPLAELTASFTVKLLCDHVSCCVVGLLVVLFTCQHENMLTSLFSIQLFNKPAVQLVSVTAWTLACLPTNNMHSKLQILLVKWIALR
jgi:hypothetical protein